MRTPIQALRKAVDLAGGQTALAKKINAIAGSELSQGHVWAWLNKENRKVPAEFCHVISQITAGRISPTELRPDVFITPDTHKKIAS